MIPPIYTPSFKVRFEGPFDFDGMYAAMTDWAKNYGYLFHEKTYKHKVPSSKGAEKEFEWVLTKKVSEDTKYKIVIDSHIWDLKEFKIKGQKSLDTGRIDLNIKGTLIIDYQKQFEGKGKFVAWLGEKYFILKGPKISLELYDNLHYRILNLQSILKKFMGHKTKNHAYKDYLGES